MIDDKEKINKFKIYKLKSENMVNFVGKPLKEIQAFCSSYGLDFKPSYYNKRFLSRDELLEYYRTEKDITVEYIGSNDMVDPIVNENVADDEIVEIKIKEPIPKSNNKKATEDEEKAFYQIKKQLFKDRRNGIITYPMLDIYVELLDIRSMNLQFKKPSPDIVDIRVSELVDLIKSSKVTVVNSLKGLEEKGYIDIITNDKSNRSNSYKVKKYLMKKGVRK